MSRMRMGTLGQEALGNMQIFLTDSNENIIIRLISLFFSSFLFCLTNPHLIYHLLDLCKDEIRENLINFKGSRFILEPSLK